MKYRQWFMQLLIVVSVLVCIGIFIANTYAQGEEATQPTNKDSIIKTIDELSHRIVDHPAFANNETISLMNKTAETKRVDVLKLLIKGLAFGSDMASNEIRPQSEMIPTIQIIKVHYGSLSLPYLYVEGITSKNNWMRGRCALAIRTIASKEELNSYNTTFSLKETNNMQGRELYSLLTRDKLVIDITPDPVEIILPDKTK